MTLPVVRTNLITNPNFDHGNITGWTSTQGGTLAVSTTQKHSGTSSLSAPTGAVPTYTKTNVTPGETISFSCYVWTSAAGAKVNTTLDFLDSSSNVIWSDGGGWVSIPASQWTRVAVTTVVPVNAATVEPSIVPFDNFSYYLDDALLEVSPDVGVYFDGDSGDSVMMYDVAGNLVPHTAAWSGTVGASTSNLTANYQQLPYLGVLGWAKARLMASLGNNIYELDPEGGEMPDPKYINPATTWTGTAIAESPQGVLVAGDAQGSNVSILEFTLDSTGGVPVLSGGSTVANLPAGESIKAMSTYMGSFLVIGTAKGIRVGTFDTTYGSLTVGPLTVPTNRPALAVAGRDRFAYGSFTDQQEDGSTGIVRMDLSYVIDSAGRLAHAPDLRPAADAAIKTGDVVSIQPLPGSGRLCFLTASGIYVEGDGPSTTGDAWLRTSRIRYDTTTLKLWTKGRVLGDPESGFSVEITRASGSTDSHTEVDDTTGEFDFDTDLDSWIRVKINLGPGSTLSSYEVSALPAPKRQHMILCSALCYTSEKDRWDNVRVDPDSPRTRWNNVTALEEAGNELVFTEYASDGTTSSDNVVIDQLQFQATSPP